MISLQQMAQLEPCRLTAQDRVGWYKERPIGFPGLACRHCKGRPGIGRYFPNTLRSEFWCHRPPSDCYSLH